MPYLPDGEVPAEIADLPKEAQQAWISVFNSTYRTFPGPENEKEAAARIAAWGAVDSYWRQETGASLAPQGFALTQASRKSLGLSMTDVRVVKFTENLMEATERITYGEVYVPWEVDAHGDLTTPAVIQRAMHGFMEKFQDIGTQHQGAGGKGKVVEAFLTRKGDRDFPIEGSGVLAVKWPEDQWQRIMTGELTGYSLEGVKTFIPLVAGGEVTKQMAFALKADGAPQAELIDDPDNITTNPRVIKLMTDLTITRVDGVGQPANRKPFKLFKSGGPPMPKTAVRVVGPSQKAGPGGPWQKLFDNLVASGMTPEQAIQMVIETFGNQIPPGWVPEENGAGAVKELQVVSFAECSAQVDALLGHGLGVKVCSLMQAKHAAGPEGGIAIPEGRTLEDVARECYEAGIQAGWIQAEAAPSGDGLLKSIAKGIGQILTRLGSKDSEQVETVKEEPMTPEDRKYVDDGFARIEAMINQALGGPKEAAATPNPAPIAAVPTVPMAPAAVANEEEDKAYAPTPVEAGKDLIELAGTIKSLQEEIVTLKSNRGKSAVVEIMSHPAHKGSGMPEPGGAVYSSILGVEIPAAARQRAIESRQTTQQKRSDRRKQRTSIKLG